MKETQHTPGPWGIERNISDLNFLITCQLSDRNRGYVASTACTNEDEEANARLIAAAPDLWEALELASGMVMLVLEAEGNLVFDITSKATGEVKTVSLGEIVRKSAEALEKAKGVQP